MAAGLGFTRQKTALAASWLIVAILLPAVCLTLPADAAYGLSTRSLQLFSDAPGATTTYSLSFTITSVTNLGSLDILFCSNSPLQNDSCSLPAGLDISGAQLNSQTGVSDFTLYSAATNEVVLSRTPSVITPPLAVTLTFTNVINPSSSGPYYLRVSAFSSTNATGSALDFGGLAFAIANNLQISSVVPPYLTFCSGLVIPVFDCSSATGDYIDFGGLSPTRSSQADSQLLVATNAPNGYDIQVYGTTMTSGNDIIPALASSTVSHPGTPQFGINLRSNTVPLIGADPSGPGNGEPTVAYNSPDHYQYLSNDTIVSSVNADNYRKYTVSYIVNVNSGQAPGVYVSTLTYVAAGSF